MWSIFRWKYIHLVPQNNAATKPKGNELILQKGMEEPFYLTLITDISTLPI